MSLSPLPANESERLAKLFQLQILDTPAEGRFDRLTRLGCRLLRVPFSMLTLLDQKRQWFKSARGHMLTEAPRAASFCAHTILGTQPLVVSDALNDQRFFDLPVVRDMGVRFYAGIPIFSQERYALGTFCVLDVEPRQLDGEDLDALQDLAAWAESEIQLMRTAQSERELLHEMDQVRLKASVDSLTRCWNQESILALVDKERQASKTLRTTLSVLVIGIHGLPEINQRHGQTEGDSYLREMSERLRCGMRTGELVGRLSGPRFLMLTHTPLHQLEERAEALIHSVTYRPVGVGGRYLDATVSVGIASARGATDTAREVVGRAEKAERTIPPGQNGRALSV